MWGWAVTVRERRGVAREVSSGVASLATDAGIALTVTGVALILGHEYRTGDWRPMDGLGYGLICLGNLPIVMRRRAPMAVLVWCCTAWTTYIAAGYWPAMNVVGVEVALYTVAARRPPTLAIAGTTLVAGIWNFAGLVDPNGSRWSALALSVVVPGVIWRFGDNARRLSERNDQLATLTAQLRQEHQARARRAVMNEQLRIARELHDVVAHHMSVICVHAGLGRYVFASDPSTSRAALDTIADTAGQAQGELRRMLALLRLGQSPTGPDEAPNPPTPGLDRLEELIDRFRTTGLPVEVATFGDRRPLPPGLDLCAYRVVQEALTNVLKHARTAQASVTLTFASHHLQVRVTDDGLTAQRAEGTTLPVVGSLAGSGAGTEAETTDGDRVGGLGLVGMRERVGLYGGQLTAGPRRGGGFEVLAVLPTPGGPA